MAQESEHQEHWESVLRDGKRRLTRIEDAPGPIERITLPPLVKGSPEAGGEGDAIPSLLELCPTAVGRLIEAWASGAPTLPKRADAGKGESPDAPVMPNF